eukprot:TRINITY_DN593_c0_g1_i4.p1 TRINITY_DN593_c0_g1~~TRINITY_DN593_c0_g1_i4.p1  ORF type:complete len:571 (-),score=168.34 TRINITY_DN593_c0_g1_i4:59-1771(-)
MVISQDDPTHLFEVKKKLGKGAYGYVYLGVDKRNSEQVAIKIIWLDDANTVEDVKKEIELLQDCNHPNIVRYAGSYVKHEYLWIVMEFCGGGSVADICQTLECGLEEDQIAVVCREALQGLQYLHTKRNIVHRDIKGGNILLKDQGEVKLADFGVGAKLFSTFTKRNTFAGTPYWMAPEVILENKYNGAADIWSLGITAIEMAETVPPHADVHPMRVLFLVPREAPPTLKSPKWSSTFRDFVARCLTKDPEKRPSAVQMLSHPFVTEAGPSTDILISAIQKCKALRFNQHSFGDDAHEGMYDENLDVEEPQPLPNLLSSGELAAAAAVAAAGDSATGSVSGGTVVMRTPSRLAQQLVSTASPPSPHSASLIGGQAAQAQAQAQLLRRTNSARDLSVSPRHGASPTLAAEALAAAGGASAVVSSGASAEPAGALLDELQAIYNRDCIRVPFLNLNYVPAASLLARERPPQLHNPGETDGQLAELAPPVVLDDGQLEQELDEKEVGTTLADLCGGKPFVQPEEMNNTLANLVTTLAHHHAREIAVPMSRREVEQTARVITELAVTLKTIFKL